jgi:hypothetical protein
MLSYRLVGASGLWNCSLRRTTLMGTFLVEVTPFLDLQGSHSLGQDAPVHLVGTCTTVYLPKYNTINE